MSELDAYLEGVRQVLVGQYAMHEVPHTPSFAGHDTVPKTLVPRAHTVADVYKCLYQAEFGIGHNIHDKARFRERVAEELREVPAAADELILESITPDDSIFRLNLRPYKSLFAEEDFIAACELLTEICAESAQIEKGNVETFFGILHLFKELNRIGGLSVDGISYCFPASMVENFLRDIAALTNTLQSVPVLGHSNIYRHLNAPAYRVVDEVVLRQSPLAFLFDS